MAISVAVQIAVGLVTAIATAMLAWVGWRALKQNTQLITAATEQAGASLAQAQAVAAQTQAIQQQVSVMTATLAPFVVIERVAVDSTPQCFDLVNPGTGVAYQAVAAYHDMAPSHRYFATGKFTLSSQSDRQRVLIDDQRSAVAMQILEDIWNPDSPTAACICKDSLGNSYRFIQGRSDRDFYSADSNDSVPKWAEPLRWPT